MVTAETLATIRVLYRVPDSMALYGIPYEMRPGQSPRDLWEGRRIPDTCRRAAGYLGATLVAPGPREDWIYLGNPGWWANLRQCEVSAIIAFLAPLRARDVVPEGPGEWSPIDG